MAVGFVSLRIEGIYSAILTLGLFEILRNLLMAIKGSIRRGDKNSFICYNGLREDFA